MLQLNDTSSSGPQYAIGNTGNVSPANTTNPTVPRFPSRLTGLSAPIQPGSALSGGAGPRPNPMTAPNIDVRPPTAAMGASTTPVGNSGLSSPTPGKMPSALGNPAQPAMAGAGMSATMTGGSSAGGPGGPPANPGDIKMPGAAIPPVSAAPQIGYGTTSQFGPGNDLQSTQIAPGAESNRFDLANQQLQTYQNQVLPQFQHDLRSTVQNNAAMGRLGSGMLNTDVGNLDLAQQNNYNNMKSSLLNTALGNQITDNANQRNELRGERDYQTGQANNAFNQGMQQTELGDQLTNSAFGRGLQQEQAGEANNPSNTSLLLSQIFGNQAGQAGQALSGLIGSTTQNNALNNNGLSQLLQTIFGGGGSQGSLPSGISPGSDGNYGIPTSLQWPTG